MIQPAKQSRSCIQMTAEKSSRWLCKLLSGKKMCINLSLTGEVSCPRPKLQVYPLTYYVSPDILSVEPLTHDWKVESLKPSRYGRRIFFSRVNFVCWLFFWCLFHPTLLQWRVKDPSHSAKSAGGRLHLNMHVYTLDPMKSEWADHAVQA